MRTAARYSRRKASLWSLRNCRNSATCCKLEHSRRSISGNTFLSFLMQFLKMEIKSSEKKVLFEGFFRKFIDNG